MIIAMNTFLATTQAGLGEILRDEIQHRWDVAPEATSIRVVRNGAAVEFKLDRDNPAPLDLRVSEDLFRVLSSFDLVGSQADLQKLGRVSLKIPGNIGGRRLRVVVQANDAPQWRSYRRLDIQNALERAVAIRSPYRVVPESGDAELWAHQIDRRLYLSLRLSTIAGRQRDYRQGELPASLRPAVAAALVRLSDPQPGDVFLDPMCGSGTILLERALFGRYQHLLGGDISQAAVTATKANFGKRHQPWKVERWDATKLTLPDGSVDAIATNPPWGKQIGSSAQNNTLYPRFIGEAARVLRCGGRLAILTSETKLMDRAVQGLELKQVKLMGGVKVLGLAASIYVYKKN